MPDVLPARPRGPAPLLRLWRYARHRRRQAVLATVASVLNTLFDIAPPYLIGMAVDVVVAGEGSLIGRWFGLTAQRDQLVALGILTVVVWVLESVTDYWADILWRNLAQTVEHELRVDAYAHVQSLDLAAFEDRSTGGLLAILNDDVNQLERFLDHGALLIIHIATSMVVIGGTYLVVAPGIGLLAVLPVPLIVWGSLRFQRLLEPRYADIRARVGILNGSLGNALGGIATIKAFGGERRELARITRESDDYRSANRSAIWLSSAFVPLIRMPILAGFTAILIVGGFRVLDGNLDVGVYTVMVFMVQRLLWPLTRLGEVLDQYQRAMASTRRVLDLLAEPRHVVGGRRPLPRARGDVDFDGVRFAYASGDEVLRGIDLHVPAGQTHAIVGATGAGKSTVVKLLLRLYDVTAGAVRLDGIDVRELRLEDLRGAIGLVSQDVFLFHGTVRENLLYGRPDATDEELAEAARLAEATEFVEALPDGYDTVVGERGQKLSGGQRQRLSIARAILRDPPVLVLDEATSAVDNETEAAIQRSLARVAHERTTIVIAHRLSTIRQADRIHVLHDGEVVEAGNHDELLALDGRYAALWRVQTGEAEPTPSTPHP
ncbi:ABC transporter ATP-binding protein [Egicoccus sp. AB-alg2]|uniref:ABC transporter ATP-binding protein n=1 Tax=Egicoccus sp. AB-alg2 TaxID=3242693 RepID=UPI00359E7A51